MSRIKVLLLAISATFVVSCSKSDDVIQGGILIGDFIDERPLVFAMVLRFNSNTELNQILTRDLENIVITSFSVRLLEDNKLELSCNACDESEPAVVHYKIIDKNTFEIGNLYDLYSENVNDEIITFVRR